jgi:hypothetical protein
MEKKFLATLGILLSFPFLAEASNWETRCGWLENPTPANYWLNDKDGSWIISVQGGHSARGADSISLTKDNEWVVTNAAEYGYGCACAEVKTDFYTKHVLEIKNLNQKRLKSCLEDMSLPNSMSCK